MKDYKINFKNSFWSYIEHFDNEFIDLMYNRISYLQKDPYKYSMISSYNKNLSTIKVSNSKYDIRIVFEVFENIVTIILLYNWSDSHDTIRAEITRIE